MGGGLLAALALAPSVHAQAVFDPAVRIFEPEVCGTSGTWRGETASGPDGATRGFATYVDPRCLRPISIGDPIYYFERTGTGWTSALTPYNGVILGVAADSTGTYLLYNSIRGVANSGLRITKRLHDGTFTPGRELAKALPTDGDVVAASSAWWAVWNVPGVGGAPDDLYQAKTLGGAQAARRITFSPTLADREPALALRSGNLPAMSWTKQAGQTSSVWLATATRAGVWTSSKVPGQAATDRNGQSDLDVYRGPGGRDTIHLAYVAQVPRKDQLVTWSKGPGAPYARAWGGAARAPRVRAVSGARFLVAYESTRGVDMGQDINLLDRRREPARSYIHGIDQYPEPAHSVVGVTHRNGKATVVYGEQGQAAALLARTQP